MSRLMYFYMGLSFVGVVLILCSVITMPETVEEPYLKASSTVWDNTRVTIAPGQEETFDLDLVVLNISIVNIHVEPSDTVLLQIKEQEPSAPVVFEQRIFPNDDFFRDIFWTYPYRGGVWYIILKNNNPTSLNATVKIIENFLGFPKTREVTHYNHIIDPNFVYVGLAAMVAGFALSRKERAVKGQDTSITYAQ